MTPRERFRRTARREPADRAVFDLCGCPQTLIDFPETREALARFLGIAGPKRGDFPLDERILERFGIDTRPVGGMPTPKTVHNRTERGVQFDSYGIGRRPVDGRWEICHNPLRDCTIDEMQAYPMPRPEDADGRLIAEWAARARRLHTETDCAVVAEHPVLGVFELGCWMFGFDDYLYRCAAEPELVHAFSRRVLAYQEGIIDRYYGALGPFIDCTTSGDDFGMQTGPFLSPDMFRELVAPYLSARIARTKSHTDAFYQHHSCGSVHALIGSLAACGVDILNPIQPGTYQMEPERLRADWGGVMAFWGGVDTQHLLPDGSPEDVRQAVTGLLTVMDRGYILSPAHCIQPDVPAANIAAIYEAAAAFYRQL